MVIDGVWGECGCGGLDLAGNHLAAGDAEEIDLADLTVVFGEVQVGSWEQVHAGLAFLEGADRKKMGEYAVLAGHVHEGIELILE
jgi:hypothetical protein